ncbi:MAG: hypothetical protein E7578_01240 [Ruminococcaceae bacterium]|nr:hypothetical protein [Oscillospiraceae bacterium]
MDNGTGWKKKHPSEIMRALGSDESVGLRRRSVSELRHRLGKNDLWNTGHPLMFFRTESGFSVVGCIVMVISALSAAAFEKCSDALFIFLSLFAGCVVTFAVYISCGILCKKNCSKWIPVCTVMREGKIIVIRADALVSGDIVMLSGGDTVCADLKLIEADELFVKDISLNKNDNIVQKYSAYGALISDEQAMPDDFICAGSQIISGSAKAVVCAVGERTDIGKKRKINLIPQAEPQELRVSRKLGTATGTFAMIFAFVAVVIGVFSPFLATDFIGLLLIFLAYAVSAGGELISILCCLKYVLSMRFCADNDVVVRDIGALEYFISCDGIAVENSSLMKTGTSKLNLSFASDKIIEPGSIEGDELFSLLYTGTGYGKGKYGSEVVRSLTEHLSDRCDYQKFVSGIETTKIVLEHKSVGGVHNCLYASGGEYYFLLTGAIDEVISKCTKLSTPNGFSALDRSILSDILSAASDASKNSNSLIAVAVRKSPYNSMKRMSVLANDLAFVGFIAVDTPADPRLVSDLAFLKREHVPFFHFTDGSGEEVSFARRAGIINSRDDLVFGNDPDTAVTKLLSEKSYGGTVCIGDESEMSAVLGSAKNAGKRLICIGNSDHMRTSGLSVVTGKPLPGTGAFVSCGENKCVTAVIGIIKILGEMSRRFGAAKKYLTISAVVRAVFAASVLFGVPYVYPSIILAWGFLLDFAVAAAILSLGHKKS